MGASFRAKDGTTLDDIFKDIERKIMPAKKGYLKVGIISDPQGGIDADTVKTTRDSKGQEKPDPQGINIVQVAAIHEYGSEKQNIPQRSFLRSTFEEQQKKITEIAAKLIKARLRKNDEIDQELLFDQIGAYLTSKVREKFRNNDWAPLKSVELLRYKNALKKLAKRQKKAQKSVKSKSKPNANKSTEIKAKSASKKSTKKSVKKSVRKSVKKSNISQIKNKSAKVSKTSKSTTAKSKKVSKKTIKNRRPLIDTGQLRRSIGWAWVQDES